jgi:prophage DNA circulation protein
MSATPTKRPNGHVFTQAEIKAMAVDDFEVNEAAIMKQLRSKDGIKIDGDGEPGLALMAVGGEKREAIINLLPSGKDCRTIATAAGSSPAVVSRVAKEVGHVWGETNLANALKAKAAYGREWRANLAARLATRVDQLVDDEFDDNEAHVRVVDKQIEIVRLPPGAASRRNQMAAIEKAVKAMLDIDTHDNSQHEGIASEIDRWLDKLTDRRPTEP